MKGQENQPKLTFHIFHAPRYSHVANIKDCLLSLQLGKDYSKRDKKDIETFPQIVQKIVEKQLKALNIEQFL